MFDMQQKVGSVRCGFYCKSVWIFLLCFVFAAQLQAKEVVVPEGCVVIPDSYIVVMNAKNSERIDVEKWAKNMADAYDGEIGFVYRRAIHGFSIQMTAANARSLGDERPVLYVQQDCLGETTATQFNPPNWGLDRNRYPCARPTAPTAPTR